MSKHTPGPWVADVDSVYAPDSNTAVHQCPDGADAPSDAEAEANARLIAAAPRLKVACQQAISALEEAQGEWAGVEKTYAPEWTHPLKVAAAEARAALEQAEPGA